MSVAPFQLEPRSEARVWGGERIAQKFNRPAPAGNEPIGESWEVYGDLKIVAGPFQGKTLDEVTSELGSQLLGSRGGDPAEGFPLLLKWLDCRDWLSVQVHPNDEIARELTGNPLARGKTECWFFLDVEPGAEIIHGMKGQATANTEGKDWLELVERKHPEPGSWSYIPAGTVHALGPGLLLFEVQQSSNITYRVYDWDRMGLDGKPREMHQAESIRVVTDPSMQTPVPVPDPDTVEGRLGKVVVTSPFFIIEEVDGPRSWQPDGHSFELISIVEGTAKIFWESGQIELKAGDSAVIPASSPSIDIERTGTTPWIRVRRP